MKVTRLLCVMSALLPALVAAQSASTQPARQRSGTAETRDVQDVSRDGSRVESGKERYADNNAPGNSGNSKGKKGEPPGQEKKKSNAKSNGNGKDKDKKK